MSNTVAVAGALFLGGLFVLALELVVPSAGVLFFLAGTCIILSVVVAFQAGTGVGLTFLGMVLVLIVLLPTLGFSLWRRSPLGRRMFLDFPDEGEPPAADDRGEPVSPHAMLQGELGKTVTPHRPSGVSEILGRRVDTVAEGVTIDAGELVRVVSVRGNRVVVRKATRKEFEDFSLPELS